MSFQKCGVSQIPKSSPSQLKIQFWIQCWIEKNKHSQLEEVYKYKI